jgi:transcriptional regulator with XRE-family HTH domain
MNVQVIEKGGRPEWAVIPYEEYQRLLEDAEMLQDVRAFDEAKQALAAGEELVPSEVTYAILDGGNPVRVWREHRGLTQQQVAKAAGISVPYLSQIESGKRKGSAAVLSAIAGELKITLEDVLDSGGVNRGERMNQGIDPNLTASEIVAFVHEGRRDYE